MVDAFDPGAAKPPGEVLPLIGAPIILVTILPEILLPMIMMLWRNFP